MMARKMIVAYSTRCRRFYFIILIGVAIFILIRLHVQLMDSISQTFRNVAEEKFPVHKSIVDRFYRAREKWMTSALGSRLFQNLQPDVSVQKNKKYTILVWKHFSWLQRRHVYNFGSAKRDPLKDCSVNNCIITGQDDQLSKADAVIVHLQRGDIPEVENRNPLQRWIFLNDESPENTFSLSSRKHSMTKLANIFNWSMTYRSDSDIPVPYGRTVALKEPLLKSPSDSITTLIPNWKKKKRDALVAILISNCGVKYRMEFIKVLRKYIEVDVYGKCSDNETMKNLCPGHFKSDCGVTSEYLFYLVLENSSCREYMTEKIWYHGYAKGAIPIVVGPSEADCNLLLPPESYLHVPFTNTGFNIRGLAEDIIRMSKDENLILDMHNWRNHFEVRNEHGYFGTKSYHLCRVCEAMNYNVAAKKVYTALDLELFLNPKFSCANY